MTFRDEDGVDRPTVAGLLVFATEPTEFLASGSIEAACYSGTRLSSDDLIHAERLAGPVSDQIDAGIAFVARFMNLSPGKGSSEGTVPAYDFDIVDEAIFYDKLPDGGCRLRPNFVVKRPQHLLNPRVRYRRLPGFSEGVQGFDDETEHQPRPSFAPRSPVGNLFNHRIANDLQGFSEKGTTRNGWPKIKTRVVVPEQGSNEMALSPGGVSV